MIAPNDIDDCNNILCRECEFAEGKVQFMQLNLNCKQRQIFLQERRERVLAGRG